MVVVFTLHFGHLLVGGVATTSRPVVQNWSVFFFFPIPRVLEGWQAVMTGSDRCYTCVTVLFSWPTMNL